MATPIKPTPMLTGRDARRFEQAIENVQKVPRCEVDEMRKSYELYRRSAQFAV